jgi:hypothetical protein
MLTNKQIAKYKLSVTMMMINKVIVLQFNQYNNNKINSIINIMIIN